MQELQEALDQETTAHRQAQCTLEEAYRHRNRLEARCDLHNSSLAQYLDLCDVVEPH